MSTEDQPFDSDLGNDETSGVSSRPAHLRPSLIALVALGGALGTALRASVTLLVPDVGDVPVAILLINVSGAFLLGVLVESLARAGADRGRRRQARLLVGTGMLGGFTTYSALATASVALVADGAALVGIAYALGTVLTGGLASWLGVLVGGRRRATGAA